MERIFSLDSLRTVRPRWPVTLLGVLGIVLILEVTARMLPDKMLMSPRSSVGTIEWMERELLPRHPKPRVIFVGTSRVRDSIVPRVVDDGLGLPAGSAVNLGLAGGRLFEAMLMYDRWQDQLGEADLVVLNVDEWFFNPNYNLGWLYEVHAPMSERVQLPAHVRWPSVLDGVFQVRPKFVPMIQTVKRSFRKRKPRGLELRVDENNQITPLEKATVDPTLITEDRFRRTSDCFYHKYEVNPVLVNHFAQFAERVRSSGAKLVLIQIPNLGVYQQYIDKHHGEAFQAHLKALRETAKNLKVPLRIYIAPQECGLEESDYVDYGHMVPSGANKLSRFLAELIKKEGWLE